MPRKPEPSAVTLGMAVRRARKQSSAPTQVTFADALGVDQTTVSKWERGEVALTVEQVRAIEDLCRLPHGQVLAWAGYVIQTVNFDSIIEAAIEGDFAYAAAKGAQKKRAGEVAGAVAKVRKRHGS